MSCSLPGFPMIDEVFQRDSWTGFSRYLPVSVDMVLDGDDCDQSSNIFG